MQQSFSSHPDCSIRWKLRKSHRRSPLQPLREETLWLQTVVARKRSSRRRPRTKPTLGKDLLCVSFFLSIRRYFDFFSVPTNTGPPSDPSSCRMRSTESLLHV